MTDINKQIINLINGNKSMKEICTILSISEKQLYVRIKQIINYGYNLKFNYMYSSDIKYEMCKVPVKYNENKVKIFIPKKENKFRCLVISDIHVGNINSNIKLVDQVYDYAAKNGINYILNCGDILEGDYTTSKKNIQDFESQIELFLKKYPYDKNINNIVILGNHDYHSLTNNGFDAAKKIKNSRYDIIPIGYGQGIVNVREDNLILFHKLNENFGVRAYDNEKIILSGHGHMMKTKLKDELWLCVPTLSNVSTGNTIDVIPGFVDLNIDFDNAKFEQVNAKHMIITPKIITASESRCRIKNLSKFKEIK